MLIEFKIKDRALDSEQDKYEADKYEEAKGRLGGKDNHHLLVYGADVVEANGNLEFKLGAKTYFQRTDVPQMFDFQTNGVNRSTFDHYLEILLSYKNPDGRSSSGGLTHEAMVVGVSASNKVVSASVREYWEESQKLQNKLQRTKTLRSGLGMRGPR